jgi:hypothetical protein
MTGKEIINIIQQNGLEDFEIKVNVTVSHDGDWGTSYDIYELDKTFDIENSDKTVTFDTIEK